MKTLRLFYVFSLFFLSVQICSAQVSKSNSGGNLSTKHSSKMAENIGTVSVQPTALFDTLFSGNKSVQQMLLINGTNGAIKYQTNAVWPDKSNRIRKYGDYADKNRTATVSRPLGIGKSKGITSGTEAFGDIVDTFLNVTHYNCGMVVVDDTLYIINYYCPCIIKYQLTTKTIIGTFPLFSDPYNITFDGNFLWVSRYNGNVYAYTLDGINTGYSFSVPYSSYIAMTWDGAYFLFTNPWSGPNPTFYRCDETGTVVETINTTLPIDVSQITWVPQHGNGHLWIVEEQTHTTYQIANDFSGIVHSFDNLFREDYCYAIAHDGKNILVGSWEYSDIYCFDDGVKEAFVTAYPPVGNIGGGDTAILNVKFNAAGMNAGDYLNNLIITTDNVNFPQLVVPASLHVIGSPQLVVNPDSLGFGLAYIGFAKNKDVVIRNNGTAVLQISNITSSNPKFSLSSNMISINPKEQALLTVSFTPTDTNFVSGTLTIFSNDSSNPAVLIPMTGYAKTPPHIVVNPLSFTENMQSGDSVYRDLMIVNTGTSDLIFNLSVQNVVNKKGKKIITTEKVNKPFSSGRKINGQNTRKTERIISYVKNSTDVSGLNNILIYEDVPDYEFYTEALDRLGLSYTAVWDWDDVNDELNSGTKYDLVIINSYSDSPSNDELDALYNYATSGGKLIYADWDVESYSTHALMNYLGFSFTNSFDEPKDFFATNSSHVIFNKPNQVTNFYWEDDQWGTDGQIGTVLPGATQLAAFDGFVTSGAVVLNTQKNCIFNAFQADNFDSDDNANGIADVQELIENQIVFLASPISFSLFNDTLAPNDTAVVQVLFDASVLNEGTYHYNIKIENNDPANQLVVVPVTLNITGTPEIVVTTDTLNYGITDVGFSKSLNLTIRNNGTGTLHINSILPADTNITTINAINIPPTSAQNITVNYLCADTGYFYSSLLIISDDTLNDTVTVYIKAYGKHPPVIAVTPTSFNENLYSGDTVARTLTISNTGASDLIINIVSSFGPAAKKPVYKSFTSPIAGNTNAKFVAKPTTTKTDSKADKKYLVVQNFNPWGYSSNFDVLNAAGIPYDVINSADLATTNLSAYHCVMIVSVQDQNYYDNIAANNAKLAQFVQLGGILDFHACSQSGENISGVTLPGGMKFVHSTSPTNYILEPTHPLVDGLPNPFTGSDASHNILTNIPANATLITKNSNNDITMVEYTYGNGTVVAMCQTLEYGYNSGWALGGIINNAVTYCFNKSLNITLSTSNDTILPGQSVDIGVVIDARNLTEGDYTGQIKIENNDPANPEFLVPVTLHVSGYPELVFNTDTIEFYNVFAGSSDTMHKVINNVGMGILTIDSIHCSNARFSYILENVNTAPLGSNNLNIVYAPITSGSDTTVFEIFSNDTANPVVSFVAIGHSLLPATIAVNATHFNYLLNTGQTATSEIVIENTGDVDLFYSLNYGQIKHLLPITKKTNIIRYFNTNRVAENNNVSIPTDFCLYAESPNAKALPKILVMEDIPYNQPYYYKNALDSLNLDYTLVSSWNLFNTYLTNGTKWNLAIVNSANNTPSAAALLAINNYIDAGGVILYSDWALSTYETNPLVGKFGISYLSNYNTPMNIGVANTHYICTAPNSLDSLYYTHNVNIIDGQLLNTDTNAVTLSNFASIGNPASVLVENNRIFNAFQAMNYIDDNNLNGKADVQEFIENQVLYLLTPWLKPQQISGIISAGATDTVHVLVDATTMQSGIYDADVNIYSNAANLSELAVHYKLYVNGQPEILVLPDTVDFGTSFINYDTTILVSINNTGALPLDISAISSNNANFTVNPTQMLLQSMTAQMLEITFNPQNVNAQQALINLSSNDPVQPEFQIYALGTGKYYDVHFQVTDTAMQPLADAAVTLGTYGTLQTNSSGEVVFNNVLPGSVNWTIIKTAYNNASGTLVVDGVENVNVTLELTTYTVTFNVTDGTNPVNGATVALTGYGTQTTSASGVAVFNNVLPAAAPGIAYTVSKTGYNTQTGNVVVDGNETVNVTLPLTTYTVTFNVTDGTNPVSGATVALTGYGTQTTNASGVAVFNAIPNGSYSYTVTKTGYQNASGTATVSGANATVPVTMNAYHTITFTVTDSVTSTALSNAAITITGLGTQTTNASGVAIFTDVINGNYSYTISKTGYINKTGTVSVNNNNPTVAIAISPVGISELANIEITMYPNPASTLVNVKTSVKMETLKIMDITGTIVKTIMVNAKTVNIDVADLAEGNYLIVVETNNGKAIRKLQIIK